MTKILRTAIPRTATGTSSLRVEWSSFFSRVRSRVWGDAAIAAGLFALALALRVPHWMTIPALTDEFKEVGWAISMVEKNQWPLVAFDAYDGPLFAYLLSFAFRLFGFNIYLPRAFVLVVGALTVVAVYFLAKELACGSRRVGLLSAALLAVNAHHILFNSHVAWSNDTTPFFTTLALFAYLRATRPTELAISPGWLLTAGLLYGLALQTHPSVLMLAPGLALDFLLSPRLRSYLKSPVPYLAAIAALIGYSPVLYYNWTTGLESFRSAQHEATYALEIAPTLYKTAANLAPQLFAIARVALGSFESAAWTDFWSNAVLIAFWTGTSAALVWMARRRDRFPLIAVSLAILFLATFNRFIAIPDSGRYFQPLLPLIFIAWSAASLRAWDWANQGSRLAKSLTRGALVSLFAILSLNSLLGLQNYYAVAEANGRTNTALLQMIDATRADRAAPILIDWNLGGLRTGRGGNIAGNLIYLCDLERRPHVLVSTRAASDLGGLRGYLREHESAYLVSFAQAPRTLGPEFPLQPLVVTHLTCTNCPVPSEFALFRWQAP